MRIRVYFSCPNGGTPIVKEFQRFIPMLKVFFFGILMLLVPAIANSQNSQSITIGSVVNIYSRELNEERRIWIFDPSGGHAPATSEKYPVFYLLDAEDHFHSTVGMIRQMTGRWPGMIVVGITNTDRNRDLKPGDGQRFISFIKNELMPFVDSTYSTAPYRIFSGHSLGGLTVINTLLNNSALFQAYIAIDPSLWWNNQQLVHQAKRELNRIKFRNASLFLGRAHNLPPSMDTVSALSDTSKYTMLYRSVTHFSNDLHAAGNNGLRWTSKYYPEESHGTVQLNAQYDALKFLFNFYQFRTSAFELNPKLNIDSALTAHFNYLSEKFGYKVVPSRSLVNNLGYTCMGLKQWKKAEAFFRMNTENYPWDANAFDSMGDFYQATGDNKKAIESYSKALTLGNDPDTKKKLEHLQSKGKP
jgi:uncharacterized protein